MSGQSAVFFSFFILHTYTAPGPFPASSITSAELVQYLIAQFLCLIFSAFQPEYSDRRTVVISVLLTLKFTCVNWRCSWGSRHSLLLCSLYQVFIISQSYTKSIASLYFGDYFTCPFIFLLDFLSAICIRRVISSSNFSNYCARCVGSG